MLSSRTDLLKPIRGFFSGVANKKPSKLREIWYGQDQAKSEPEKVLVTGNVNAKENERKR